MCSWMVLGLILSDGVEEEELDWVFRRRNVVEWRDGLDSMDRFGGYVIPRVLIAIERTNDGLYSGRQGDAHSAKG